MSGEDIITLAHPVVSLNKTAVKRKEPVKTKPLNFKDIEKDSIVQALSVNKGNAVKAAEDLHISKATIYRKIKAYSIDLKRIKKLA